MRVRDSKHTSCVMRNVQPRLLTYERDASIVEPALRPIRDFSHGDANQAFTDCSRICNLACGTDVTSLS